MKITDLEEEIFNREGIRVLIRAPRETEVQDYTITRKAPGNMTIEEWVETRLKPILGDMSFEIIRGTGKIKYYPRAKLDTIRDSYMESDNEELDLETKKVNLKSGYIVLLKNNRRAVVMLNSPKGDILVLAKEKFRKMNETISISMYDENLTHTKDDDLSVVDIYPMDELNF